MRYQALLAGGAAAAMLGLAACGQLENNEASAPQSSSNPPSSSVSKPSSPAPQPSSSAPESPAPTSDAGDQGGESGGDCKAASLKLSLSGGDAGAGTAHQRLTFTNSGDKPCQIQGFPGVSYVGGDNGKQIGQPAKRVGSKGAPIKLAPGDSASADVGFVQVHNFDENSCKPSPVRGLRVYPPHDTASMFVAKEGTGCAGSTPEPQLTVATVSH